MRIAFVTILVLLAAGATAAADFRDRLVDPETAPYRLTGAGFITSDSHPKRPSDIHRYDVKISIAAHPQLGEYVLEFLSGIGEKEEDKDLYYVRRGRVFQVDKEGKEEVAAALVDLEPGTVAALSPAIVANAIRERHDMVRADAEDALLFAWNDELWTVDLGGGYVRRLARRYYNDRLGDQAETVAYELRSPSPDLPLLQRTVVTSGGREIANLEFTGIERGIAWDFPEGDMEQDRAWLIAPEEIALAEIAPHLFTIDLPSMNTRVMVAEFQDHLAVLEGVYNSRICDLIAAKVRDHFEKPVRYFAFSHLHGQYIGGTRSWVQEGATVISPASTVPLLEEIAAGQHELRPDALSRDPRPLQVKVVNEKHTLKDKTNELRIFNIESEHTDEYFIFYFPRQKVLLAGDLLWYREGKPFTGRSKKLCEAVERLKLDVERYYCTWPLDGYETKNIVSREEMRLGCEAAPATPAGGG